MPTSLATVVLTGHYLRPDGSPARGAVTFRAGVTLVNEAADEIVVPQVTRVDLDEDGRFSVTLPATDDSDWEPSSWTYRVEEHVGAKPRTFHIALPFDSPGGTVDMADVVPIDPSSGEVSGEWATEAFVTSAVGVEAAARAAAVTAEATARGSADTTLVGLITAEADARAAADAVVEPVAYDSNHTATEADCGKALLMDGADLTVPTDLPLGAVLAIVRAGAGASSVLRGAGTAFVPTDADVVIAGQWGTVTVHQVEANTWLVHADAVATG